MQGPIAATPEPAAPTTVNEFIDAINRQLDQVTEAAGELELRVQPVLRTAEAVEDKKAKANCTGNCETSSQLNEIAFRIKSLHLHLTTVINRVNLTS